MSDGFELGTSLGLSEGPEEGPMEGAVVGLDVDGDSDGNAVVGTGVRSGVGPETGAPVGFGAGVSPLLQPHGSEIASAKSCAPTHSDCVNSELSPACSTSRHWIPAINPFRVASRPDKHNTQKTLFRSGSIVGTGVVVGIIAGAGAAGANVVGLLPPPPPPPGGGQPHLSPTSANAWTVAHCSVEKPVLSLN